MKKITLSSISEIIKDAKKGKMFILVDDKSRENEGDLVIPAIKCNSKNINFMAKNGRGLICLALTKKQVDKLSLPLMSAVNKARMQTAFTVSIEAKRGITTGISAFDRAKTIKVAVSAKSKKKDIVSPGHVFPLVARIGGVLERAGHTEASVDISKLANLNPSAVICEVMNGSIGTVKENAYEHPRGPKQPNRLLLYVVVDFPECKLGYVFIHCSPSTHIPVPVIADRYERKCCTGDNLNRGDGIRHCMELNGVIH